MTDINEIEICEASEWGPWGECSKSCGGGIQYSNRFPLNSEYTEYDCGSLTRSRVCNSGKCPVPVVALFKHIDYKEKKFTGWSEDEVISACEKNINILKVTDSQILYHDFENELEVGTMLTTEKNSELSEYFTISSIGEYVYANGKFIKIKNRQVVGIYECNFTNSNSEDDAEWCGSEFTRDSYVCVTGTNETAGVVNSPISDRYYYSQDESSHKTKWISTNNLLEILFLSATDPRNTSIKRNIWALVNGHEILYYNIDFDESKSCPPLNSTWLPVIPFNSNIVKLTKTCQETSCGELKCDLKDATIQGWFDLNTPDEYVNVFEKNLTNQVDIVESKNDFIKVLQRGSGLPPTKSNVYQQSFRGYFNINKLSTNPVGVGVGQYFEKTETGGDILHKIEFPLTNPVDLVNLKIMTVMNTSGHFDLQVYSLEKQKWIHIETVHHFTQNQQIVTNVKNDYYSAENPPLNGLDIVEKSVVAVRLFVGNYDYDTEVESPIEFFDNKQGLLIHALRLEGRKSEPCCASEISYIVDRQIKQVVKQTAIQPPKLYEGFTEIVGDLCVGNTLYGNYKYEGIVDAIYYEWSVNDVVVSDTRHISTHTFDEGSVLKFKVTFAYNKTETKTFVTTATLTSCKTKIFPEHDNSANFNYISKIKHETAEQIIGYDWPDVACATEELNIIKFYWTGNLVIGKQISTESNYQTTEFISSGRQYFLCKEENCIIKLSKDLVVADVLSCPPSDFNLIYENSPTLESTSDVGTVVGVFTGTQVNKNIKYNLNNNSFGIHNNLFELVGSDPFNNLQNVNLVVTGDISNIGSSAKISVYAESATGVGFVEKNFTLNINTTELQRYADCPRITMSGFNCDFMNGNYGLIYYPTTSDANSIGYAYHDKKYVYRTSRKFTDGFLLLDGTVEFGSGYVFSEIRWSETKSRWELYVYADDNGEQSVNFNESYTDGKLCAFAEGSSLYCPVGLQFTGISISFGTASSAENGLVHYGGGFSSDCTELGIC